MTKARPRSTTVGGGDKSGPRRVVSLRVRLALIVAFIAGALYANTWRHGFVRDDFPVIAENTFTHRGWPSVIDAFTTTYREGSPVIDALYRPLSKAFFAAEWAIAPGSPVPGHVVNILLYALTGFLLFLLLHELLGGPLIAFVASLLFVTHPLHTEVVANIKSHDELLCFVMFVVATIGMLRFAKGGSWLGLALGAVAYLLALFAKESAVTFVLAIPLAIWCFARPSRGRLLTVGGVLVAAVLLFLAARQAVLADIRQGALDPLDNYLVAIASPADRFATALMLLGVYVKMLFVPHPLISDASLGHFPVVTLFDWRALASALAFVALVIAVGTQFRRRPAVAFGVLFFAVTVSLVSNVAFLIGTNYGERLLYAPSLGWCVAIAALIVPANQQPTAGRAPATVRAFLTVHARQLAIAGAIAAVFAAATLWRTPDWRDGLTLGRRDVERAPGSARVHVSLAASLIDALKPGAPDASATIRAEVIPHLEQSLAIYPTYHAAYSMLGMAYERLGDARQAVASYRQAIALAPTEPTYHQRLAVVLMNAGQARAAVEEGETAVRLSPAFVAARANLAIQYTQLALSIADSVRRISGGAAAGARGALPAEAMDAISRAYAHLDQALAVAPRDSAVRAVAGAVYRVLGDTARLRQLIGGGGGVRTP